MASLDDLYRARRGMQNEQVENFLSATTGLLIDGNAHAARAFLGLYGIDVPDSASVTASSQDPIYKAKDGAPAGIPDLVLTWPEDGELRRVIVEAKVDAKLSEAQPQGYADAAPDATVVTLTPHVGDAGRWSRHATWSAWHAALDGMDSDLARALRSQIGRRAELASPAPLDLDQLVGLQAEAALIERWNRAMRRVIRHLVPKRLRPSLPKLGSKAWDEEGDVGAWFEISRKRARREGLPMTGLGLRLDLKPGGFRVVASVLVKAGQRSRLAKHPSVPWYPEPGSDWLDARVGRLALGEKPLATALLEPAFRVRGLLGGELGAWSRVTRPKRLGKLPDTTTQDLATAIRRTQATRQSADRLSTLWLSSAHTAASNKGRCRPIDRSRDRFYVEDALGRACAQLDAAIDPGNGTQPAASCCWFKRTGPAQAYADALDALGWTVRVEVRKGRQRNVLVHPPAAEIVRPADVQRWGRVQADALMGALQLLQADH